MGKIPVRERLSITSSEVNNSTYFLDASRCQNSWEKQSLPVAVDIMFIGTKRCCHVRVREA